MKLCVYFIGGDQRGRKKYFSESLLRTLFTVSSTFQLISLFFIVFIIINIKFIIKFISNGLLFAAD